MEFLSFFQCFELRGFTGTYRTVFRSLSIFKPRFISDVNTSASLVMLSTENESVLTQAVQAKKEDNAATEGALS